jgi:hypothetical protein
MDVIEKAIDGSGFHITQVVSGGARGVDSLGEMWAKEHDVPVKIFPAQWHVHGRSAGYRRNVEMAKNADALIACWDEVSKGTKHMIDIAREKGLTVYVFKTSP